jgi:predicted dinucleotide-binding enzyme
VRLAVPWGAIDQALAEVGSLGGNVVVDAANPYGPGPQPAPDQTLAAFDSARRSGARYVQGFDTLISGFQAQAANRSGNQRPDSSPPHHPPDRDRP